MNRKTFLSSLSAILLAPFIGKSKEKTISIPPEDAAWLNANPTLINQLYEKEDDDFVTIYVDGEPIPCRMSTYHEEYQEPPFPVTITKEDAEYISFKKLEIPKNWKI
jgi:hypothetical protein